MTIPSPTPVPCPKCQPPADCTHCGNTRLCYFVPAKEAIASMDRRLICQGYFAPDDWVKEEMTQAGVWIWGPIFEEGEKI